MRSRLAPLAVLALTAAGCGLGSSSQSGTTTTTTAATTSTARPPVSPQPTPLTVFRVKDNGALRAEVVSVPHTTAVASSALGALDVAAPVEIAGGTATVQLDSATPAQVAEIVYTLTQYGSIKRVDVAGRSGLTRSDVIAFVPPILVESPGAGAQIARTFTVSGTASVFEATFVVELRQGSSVVEKRTATASEGAPGRGTFSVRLHAPAAGEYTVAAYAPSAADGTPQHEQDLTVTAA